MVKESRTFSANDRIVHSVYGLGTVVSVADRHTIIEFDEHGRRKFVTTMIQLDHSDEPAPEPKAARSRAKKSAKGTTAKKASKPKKKAKAAKAAKEPDEE